ncbi:hypothetical protein L1765_05885 [Microaerobacter geothermalis]|uniref:hypothetical protein n=1 Tax=Microaerobacter geothermalis TaxID=674972 RepID=UPI001F3DD4B9|nr:hypothetical protein [Microaerobacter geothermalis]MCF6093516.1 hypothetical protein [Microaerobacter geothermalis]
MVKERLKVTIRCNKCGERYTLRGTVTKGGKLETGFKRCLCDNDKDFKISSDQF